MNPGSIIPCLSPCGTKQTLYRLSYSGLAFFLQSVFGGYQSFLIFCVFTGTPDPPHSLRVLYVRGSQCSWSGSLGSRDGTRVPRRVPTVVHHLSFSYRDSRPTPLSQSVTDNLGVCVPGVGVWVPRRVPTVVCDLVLFRQTVRTEARCPTSRGNQIQHHR